jgi:5'-nucleotidase
VNGPVVLVDMDGVLADFDAEVLARLAAHHPHVPRATRQNFYIAEDYPEHTALLRQISSEPGFFAALPLVDGALEGWQRIVDLGYHPRVCTSPLRRNRHCEAEKLGWLEKHFAPVHGEAVAREAIVTRDKHLCDGIALIDDRPEIRHSATAPWQHIVFDRPYNQDGDHAGDRPRLRGWHDDTLGALLDAARDG